MEKIDKKLLLEDLSARLPYGVKCQFEDTIRITDGESSPFYDYILSARDLDLFINNKNFYIKPYLRPMSSMTEGEKIYIDHKWGADNYGNMMAFSSYEGGVSEIELADIIGFQDWLLKNHFDYRGLIPKGLAIEVNKENNPYKD